MLIKEMREREKNQIDGHIINIREKREGKKRRNERGKEEWRERERERVSVPAANIVVLKRSVHVLKTTFILDKDRLRFVRI